MAAVLILGNDLLRRCFGSAFYAPELSFLDIARANRIMCEFANQGIAMPRFEYKVIPAPVKAMRAKGVKGTDNRFAHALMTLMNELGAEGWEYQRTDTLPCEERSGLTGKTTTFRNMLVFRRNLEAELDVAAPVIVPAETPSEDTPVADTVPEPIAAQRTPEDMAAAAVASLTADAPEGNAPAIAKPREGSAPDLGPAKRSGEDVAAE